ncbi:MAG: ABC transporter permease [Natronosporangium sp.]
MTTLTERAPADAPPRTTTRRRSSTLRRIIYSGAVLGLLLAAWEYATRATDVSPLLLPPLAEVWTTMVDQWSILLPYAWLTLGEAVLGFGLAVGIGMPLGILIVFSRPARDTVYPLLVASQMVPKIALAPILVVWFGLGLTSKVAIAFLISFFAIVVSTALGMEAVDRDMVRLFRSMRSGTVRTFVKLRLPMATPSIFAGFRLGMTHAVTGAIVGEFITANSGLGYYILHQYGQLQTAAVYAGVILIAIMGVGLYFALEVVELIVSPYRRRRRGGRRALRAGSL